MAKVYARPGRRLLFSASPTATAASANTLLVMAIVIAGLYFGRDLLVPLAIAVLLSFMLTPLVRGLQRFGAPKAPAVIGVVLLAFSILLAASYMVAQQVPELAARLPFYETQLAKKLKALRGSTIEGSALEKASETIKDLSKEISDSDKAQAQRKAIGGDTETAPPQAPKGTEKDPLVVAVRPPQTNVLDTYQSILAALVPPIAMTLLVFLYATFILMQRQDLRDRVIRLAGGDLERTTTAMADAGQRLSYFFLTQALINSLYGIVIGLALWAIGVPNPVLWGGLAFLMRYVPYVGSILAAGFPLILAAAVDPTWSMFYATFAIFAVGEGMMGQVVEPMVLGRSTGLSPFAFIVAATFWTALWGPIGLVLATPLTSILVVLGRHVERLNFLDVLLGDQPVLSNDEMLYQRLLAGDPDEASEQAEKYMKEASLLAYYDDVAMGALRLAQRDMERGVLSDEKLDAMTNAIAEIVDDLAFVDERTPETSTEDDVAAPFPVGSSWQNPHSEEEDTTPEPELEVLTPERFSPSWRKRGTVLCVTGRSPLDRPAADCLMQLLNKHGLEAAIISYAEMSTVRLKSVDREEVGAIVLSYMGFGKRVVHLKSLIGRCRSTCPDAVIIAGLWSEQESRDGQSRFDELKVDEVVTSLRSAVACCIEQATAATPAREDHVVDVTSALPSGGEAARVGES